MVVLKKKTTGPHTRTKNYPQVTPSPPPPEDLYKNSQQMKLAGKYSMDIHRTYTNADTTHIADGLTDIERLFSNLNRISASRSWCRTVGLSLSHWYPGSGVVLDCIDS